MAYHFHWSLAEILDLEHPLRRAFATQIDRICAQLAGGLDEHETAPAGW